MRIPSELSKTLSGPENIVPVNPDYTYIQITVGGRNTGAVTVTARPILASNNPDDFHDDEFEHVEQGVIDLSSTPPKRTITIESRRVSALRFADAGAGDYTVYCRSWGLVTN